jgi:hypothetical protein
MARGLAFRHVRVAERTDVEAALGAPGGVVIQASLKSYRRADAKVATKYDNDPRRLLDVLRGSIAVDSFDELFSVAGAIRASDAHLARVPLNRFQSPTPSHYRDCAVYLRLRGGVIAEVQLHVKEILKAKELGYAGEAPEHLLYEEVRAIEEAAAAERREVTADERERREELLERCRRMYDAAAAASGVPIG